MILVRPPQTFFATKRFNMPPIPWYKYLTCALATKFHSALIPWLQSCWQIFKKIAPVTDTNTDLAETSCWWFSFTKHNFKHSVHILHFYINHSWEECTRISLPIIFLNLKNDVIEELEKKKTFLQISLNALFHSVLTMV